MLREPSEEVKLKECPWCGSHAEVFWSVSEGSRTAGCSNPLCAVHPVAKKSTDPAVTIERWQNRVPSESVNADLLAALKLLYAETADYIRVNNLGDAHHNRSMQLASAAIAKAETGEAVSETNIANQVKPNNWKMVYGCRLNLASGFNIEDEQENLICSFPPIRTHNEKERRFEVPANAPQIEANARLMTASPRLHAIVSLVVEKIPRSEIEGWGIDPNEIENVLLAIKGIPEVSP